MEGYPFLPDSESPRNPLEQAERDFNPEKRDKDTKKAGKIEQKERENKSINRKQRRLQEREDKKKEKEKLKSGEADERSNELEQKKREVAKEFVEDRAATLRQQLEVLPENSAKYNEIRHDLALIETLQDKFENPDLEVEMQVQEAYEEIMANIDEREFKVDKDGDNEKPSQESKATDYTDNPDINSSFLVVQKQRASKKDKVDEPNEDKTLSSSDAKISTNDTNETEQELSSSESIGPDSGIFNNDKQTNTPTTRNKIQNKESLTSSNREVAAKKNTATAAIIGGAIGYMIGRRNETPLASSLTIKNEKVQSHKPEMSYKPETVKLNSEPNITKKIEQKEESIRSTIRDRQKTQISQPEATKKFSTPFGESKHRSYETFRQANSFRPERNNPEKARIAHEVLKTMDISPPFPSNARRETVPPRRVEQFTTPELLEAAKNLSIEGNSVRKLYNSYQIDRYGLIEIVKTALRGGNLKQAYEKRKLGKEAIRGRKIEMRHDDGSSADSTINQITKQASVRRVEALKKDLRNSQENSKVKSVESTSPVATTSLQKTSQEKARTTIKKKYSALIALAVIGIGFVSALVWIFVF